MKSLQLHGHVKDISGHKFQALTVLNIHQIQKHKYYYLCLCDCGNQKIVRRDSLTSGDTKSCGCLVQKINSTGNNRRTHGKQGSPEYRSWNHAKQRCINPKDAKFLSYGARGISMCDRWLNSFENFFEDMGERPSKTHSLDRINVDGNYEPSNCRWATPTEQANNKRNNYNLTLGCVTLSVAAWERELGFKSGVIKQRLSRGWDEKRSLTTPLQTR